MLESDPSQSEVEDIRGRQIRLGLLSGELGGLFEYSTSPGPLHVLSPRQRATFSAKPVLSATRPLLWDHVSHFENDIVPRIGSLPSQLDGSSHSLPQFTTTFHCTRGIRIKPRIQACGLAILRNMDHVALKPHVRSRRRLALLLGDPFLRSGRPSSA